MRFALCHTKNYQLVTVSQPRGGRCAGQGNSSVSLAGRIVDSDGPWRLGIYFPLSFIHPENFGWFAGEMAHLIARLLQNSRCAPKLFLRFVLMHIAAIFCHFWAGLEAQSQGIRSLRTVKFWPSGQAKEKSTRMLSASARVPGGSAAPRGTLGSRVQA